MKPLALALLLLLAIAPAFAGPPGWVFYSLGYFDHDGRFVLSVQTERFDDQETCETVLATATERGWAGLCAPDDQRER